MVAVMPVINRLETSPRSTYWLIEATTDEPAFLYLLYQYVPPTTTPRIKVVRGVPVTCGYTKGWFPLACLAQYQPIASTQHTWAVPFAPEEGTTYYFISASCAYGPGVWTAPPLQTPEAPPLPQPPIVAAIHLPVSEASYYPPGTHHAFYAEGSYWLITRPPGFLNLWRLTPGPPIQVASVAATGPGIPRINNSDARLSPGTAGICVAAQHTSTAEPPAGLYYHLFSLVPPYSVSSDYVDAHPMSLPPFETVSLEVDTTGEIHILFRAPVLSLLRTFYVHGSPGAWSVPEDLGPLAAGLAVNLSAARSDPLATIWLLTTRSFGTAHQWPISFSGLVGAPVALPASIQLQAGQSIAATNTEPTCGLINIFDENVSVTGVPPGNVRGPFGAAYNEHGSLLSTPNDPANQAIVYFGDLSDLRYATRVVPGNWTDVAAPIAQTAGVPRADLAYPNVAIIYYPDVVDLHPIVLIAKIL